MKKLSYYLLISVLVVGLLISYVPNKSMAQQTKVYNLKLVSFLPRDNVMMAVMWNFREILKRKTNEVVIDYVGGPESIPGHEQDIALAKGIVDIHFAAPSYYQTRVPEVQSLLYSKLTPMEERASGYMDFLNERHNKINIQVLGRTQFPDAYRMEVKKNIVDPRKDFKGLVIRGQAHFKDWMEKHLGMAYTVIPPGDVYTALDRGIIQGIIWGGLGHCDYGWPKVCKYVIEEPNLCPAGNCLLNMNLDTWTRLPKHLQKLLVDVQIENDAWTKNYYEKERKRELERMQEMGLQVIRFSPVDSQWYCEGTYTYGWKNIEEKCPETVSKLKQLLQVK